jgi:DNA-directed RNA polymerase III subunit RPC2
LDDNNYFINVAIKKILEANREIQIKGENLFLLRYTNIYVGKPCIEEDLAPVPITPQQCRLRDITYAAPIYVDIEYTQDKLLVVRKAMVIGRMPIMLRSSNCICLQSKLNSQCD